MNIIVYLFCCVIGFSVSGNASDRPEDVIRKAKIGFAQKDVEFPSVNKELLRPFAINYKTEELSQTSSDKKKQQVRHPQKSLELQQTVTRLSDNLGCPVMTSQEFRTQREDHNDQLLHALNAGISLLFDYLLQFQNDDDLTWTFETYPIYAGPTGTELIPLNGVDIIEKEVKGISCNYVATAYYYEIMRQKSCIDLSTILGLMRFWKKSIFPNSTIGSYDNIDALALKDQVQQRVDRLKGRTESRKNQNLWKLNFENSIVYVLEDLLAKFPKHNTSFVNGLKIPKNYDFEGKEKLKLINQKKRKYDEFYLSLITLTAQLTSELNSLIMDPLKQFVKSNYIRDFQKIYNRYLGALIFLPSEKKQNILNFEKLFMLIQRLNLQENIEPTEKIAPEGVMVSVDDTNDSRVEPKPFSLIIELVSLNRSGPQYFENYFHSLMSQLDNRSLVCLASVNKFFYENLSEVLSKRLEAHYSEAYWKAENLSHQQRKSQKGESTDSIQEVCLTDYEIDLFSFLKENIFRINCHLKVSKLKSDLSNLFFDVVVNKNGKGSLHYVSSVKNNPIFGHISDYQGAYFNVHLPHSNDVIPAPYFRYLQSGFKNIFGLSSEYIDSRLKSVTRNREGA